MLSYKFYSGKVLDGKKINRPYRIPKTYERELSKSKLWKEGEEKELVDFSDLSEYSVIKQYLDGLENLYLKYNYAKIKRYYNPKTFIIRNHNLNFYLPPGLWFLKISTDVSGSGQDIFVVKNKGEVQNILKRFDKNTIFVLQRGIENPFLVDGRKTDIRFYTMITYIDNKINVYVYRNYLLRLSIQKYDKDSKNKFSQLTNTSIAVKNKQADLDSFTILAHENENQKLFKKFEDVVKDTIRQIEIPKTDDKGFTILGYDFMVTEDLEKVYLIEVNRRPSFYEYDDPLKKLLHKNLEDYMVKENIEIINSLLLKDYIPKLNKWKKIYL
jgi:hypothetical protein